MARSRPPCHGVDDPSDRVCCYFFLRELGRWDSALAAADFDCLLVRPSRRTPEAAVAALLEVVFDGAFLCERALPAAALDVLEVALLFNVPEALRAAERPVTLVRAIVCSWFLGDHFRQPGAYQGALTSTLPRALTQTHR